MCSLPVRTTLFPYTTLFRSDEINRTPPKTQSALLEAMEERQVTVDGRTMPLPDPFMVIATQNPVEYEGTYTLPEAQLDGVLGGDHHERIRQWHRAPIHRDLAFLHRFQQG